MYGYYKYTIFLLFQFSSYVGYNIIIPLITYINRLQLYHLILTFIIHIFINTLFVYIHNFYVSFIDD